MDQDILEHLELASYLSYRRQHILQLFEHMQSVLMPKASGYLGCLLTTLGLYPSQSLTTDYT